MENKYNCEKCNFKCNTKARWDAHINTELHKTGQRKIRSDYKEPFKCVNCNYETKNIVMMKIHKLNKHSNTNEREKEFKYYCKYCDYYTYRKNNFTKHTLTSRHSACYVATTTETTETVGAGSTKQSPQVTDIVTTGDTHYYMCEICNKLYKNRSGLWKHKKTKHNDKPIKNDSKICKYCNKEFSDRSNRWRHENTICKLKK